MTEEEKSLVAKSSTFQRIATLDAARGLAIFLMTFFHGFYHIYDYTWLVETPNKIYEYSKLTIGFMGILVYFGTWNTFFLLVSCAVNSLGMARAAFKNANLKILLIRRLIMGFGLLIANYVIEGLGYYGILGKGLRAGKWAVGDAVWEPLFQVLTLQIIAWSLIFTSIINYLLLRKKGHANPSRNRKVYIILILCVIAATPFVHSWIDGMDWAIPESLSDTPDLVEARELLGRLAVPGANRPL